METSFNTFDVSTIKPIRDVIYESLRQSIFDGELKAGDRLVEKELADKMKVSRTPIREALRKLEAEGLVEHLPRRGVVVKGFSREDVIEIYSIRKALEGLAITYTVRNITDQKIVQLKELIKEMEKLTEEGDIKELFKVNQRFNDILVNSSKMPRLIHLINTYMEYLQRLRIVTMSCKQRRLKALNEHKAILNAVIDRDEERARQLVEEHIEGSMKEYLKVFDAQNS